MASPANWQRIHHLSEKKSITRLCEITGHMPYSMFKSIAEENGMDATSKNSDGRLVLVFSSIERYVEYQKAYFEKRDTRRGGMLDTKQLSSLIKRYATFVRWLPLAFEINWDQDKFVAMNVEVRIGKDGPTQGISVFPCMDLKGSSATVTEVLAHVQSINSLHMLESGALPKFNRLLASFAPNEVAELARYAAEIAETDDSQTRIKTLTSMCMCMHCEIHIPGRRRNVCAGCHVAVYCGLACQRSNWYAHKAICPALAMVLPVLRENIDLDLEKK